MEKTEGEKSTVKGRGEERVQRGSFVNSVWRVELRVKELRGETTSLQS